MLLLRWLHWWAWTSRRCAHVPGRWRLRDQGRIRVRYCEHCDRRLDVVQL
jgi:hypothetical protein